VEAFGKEQRPVRLNRHGEGEKCVRALTVRGLPTAKVRAVCWGARTVRKIPGDPGPKTSVLLQEPGKVSFGFRIWSHTLIRVRAGGAEQQQNEGRGDEMKGREAEDGAAHYREESGRRNFS